MRRNIKGCKMCLENCGFIFNRQICECHLDISQTESEKHYLWNCQINIWCMPKILSFHYYSIIWLQMGGWNRNDPTLTLLVTPELSLLRQAKMSAVKMTMKSFDTVQQTRKTYNRSDKCLSKLEWYYKWAIWAHYCKLVKLSEHKVVLHDNKMFSLALHSIGFTFSWICFSQADSQTRWCKLSQLKHSGWRQNCNELTPDIC